MSTWRVQPFAWGVQENEGVFANFQEAIAFASKKARHTRVRWAIFDDDHKLDTIVAPEDKMPWENRELKNLYYKIAKKFGLLSSEDC